MSDKCYLEMPQEYKTKWLEALRSGKYEQGHNSLVTFANEEYDDHNGCYSRSDEPTGFCCLGVLVDTLDGRETLLQDYSENELPSDAWYASKGMESFTQLHEDIRHRAGSLKSGERADSLLWTKNDGYTTKLGDHVAPQSFSEIADFIEANVKGV